MAARGRRSGPHPSGAARLGARRSKSAPSPKSRNDRYTQDTGPPRSSARASAPTAANAARHQSTAT
eukprot:5117353-Lingulodinium_polyedra.AAC.1